jgi:repressor LexA
MDIGQRIKLRREELNISAEELGKKIGKAKTTIYRYEMGYIEKMPTTVLSDIADALRTTPAYLMGWTEKPTDQVDIFQYDAIRPITTKKVRMIGKVACGEPIYADEDKESYIQVGTDINADFCVTASGDSMTGARIYNGDIVFCRSQELVNNGEIAVIIIGEDVTLKRVYFYPEKQKLVLQAENPKYEPFVYVGEELDEIRIIGKAVAFQSDVK